MILRCTRKLLTVLGSAVAEPAPAPDPEDWYANLVRFDRRTCLLLTHSATLFTIFEADVTASALRATRQLVTGLIGRELRREELPAGTFGDLGQQGAAVPTSVPIPIQDRYTWIGIGTRGSVGEFWIQLSVSCGSSC